MGPAIYPISAACSYTQFNISPVHSASIKRDGKRGCGEVRDRKRSCGEVRDREGSCWEVRDGEGSCGEVRDLHN